MMTKYIQSIIAPIRQEISAGGINRQALTARSLWTNQVLQAFCMALVWSFYLLVFWPGTAMTDTYAQWYDFFTNHYNNWYSVLQTFLMKIIAGPSMSAPAVVFSQILGLSMVVAWGLRVMRRYGTPLWLTWLVTLIFIIIPGNGAMAIFIVKDVYYAITFLAFSIFFAEMVLTNGEWIKRPRSWIALGCVSALLALFRHNGLPLVLMTLLPSLLLFRARAQIAAALAVFAVLYFAVVGPLYSITKVKSTSGLRDSIFLYHIAAHLKYGNEIDGAYRDYLNQLLPIKDWKYDPCMVDSIYWHDRFNHPLFEQNSDLNVRIFLKTLLRNPAIDIRHAWNAVDFVFNPFSSQCTSRQQTMLYRANGKVVWTYNNGTVNWVAPDVQAALWPASRLPSYVDVLYRYIDATRQQPVLKFFTWNNAFFIYFGILTASILAYRKRGWKFLLVAAPILVQSIIMAMVLVSSEFRYQYPVMVFSLFSICFLGINGRGYTDHTERHG